MPAKGRPIALTKYIAGYVKEIPVAWDAYLKEKSKGTEGGKAERAAMRSVYPGDNNVGVRLDTWKRHKFWPDAATAEIKETWESFRASLSQGIKQDEAESEAVKTVLHDYPHPAEALAIWKRCGVWSTEFVGYTEEYREAPSISLDRSGVSETTSRVTSKKSRRIEDNPSTSRDISGTSQVDSGISREEVMAQFRSLLAEITVEERKWFGKATGKAPEEEKFQQIGAKLPPELVTELKNLPGRHAHHLERALKLYLMVLRSADR